MDQKSEAHRLNTEDKLLAENNAIATNAADMELMKMKQREVKERNTKHWHDELQRSRNLEDMKPKEV